MSGNRGVVNFTGSWRQKIEGSPGGGGMLYWGAYGTYRRERRFPGF